MILRAAGGASIVEQLKPVRSSADTLDDFLNVRLGRLSATGGLRTLRLTEGLIDFCSNDYLGLARRDLAGVSSALPAGRAACREPAGSGGSRLLAGNSRAHEELEAYLAEFYRAESALLCNSGYCANLSVFSTLPTRHDFVVHDELVHASIRDGLRLSPAPHVAFRHNDLEHLESRLKNARGMPFVVVESVYSMDGDGPDFVELVALCERYGAVLCVDEAHGVGVFGKHGRGVLEEAGVTERVPVRVYTFGKALGAFGAVVTGSHTLKTALVNFARPFIFATALPPAFLTTIRAAHDAMREADTERQRIRERLGEFRLHTAGLPAGMVRTSLTTIQAVVVPGNEKVTAVASRLGESGFDVRPIRSPTVPAGSERLRISLHAFNTGEEVAALCRLLAEVLCRGAGSDGAAA